MTIEESNGMWNELTAKFIEVRDTLKQSGHQYAHRMAFKQPWRFYRERTPQEAINELISIYNV